MWEVTGKNVVLECQKHTICIEITEKLLERRYNPINSKYLLLTHIERKYRNEYENEMLHLKLKSLTQTLFN